MSFAKAGTIPIHPQWLNIDLHMTDLMTNVKTLPSAL
jgi:hypothetical protein